MIDNSNDEAANRQVANPSKMFENISSAKMKLPKTQISKMVHPGEFLGRIFKPFNKIWFLIDEKCDSTIS